jgi:hypothetical protein
MSVSVEINDLSGIAIEENKEWGLWQSLFGESTNKTTTNEPQETSNKITMSPESINEPRNDLRNDPRNDPRNENIIQESINGKFHKNYEYYTQVIGNTVQEFKDNIILKQRLD